MTLRATSQI